MAFGFHFGRPAKARGKILVAFASQTGAAERIAWLSANALAAGPAGNFVRVAALGSLTADEIAEAGLLLAVVSTYGAGEAPDSVRPFMRRQMAQTPALKGLDYAVLALGDKKYDATFCGFGRSLDRWLASGKARRLFDLLCVDGGHDIAAMTKWCEQLTRLGADTDVQALMPGPPQDWILTERLLLNESSPGGQAWRLALTPANPAHLVWTAGDNAEIWPRNEEATVEQFLSRYGLDGAARFAWRGTPTALRDIVAHSRIPKPHEMEGIALEWLVERLEAYPSREYSIASLPACGRMELLVRKAVKDDGSLGLGSGWLTHACAVGGMVKLRLRPNPNFHPPRDRAGQEPPMILIGAGTGIAGLRAHLLHRQQQKLGDAWLLLGERSRTADLYFGADIAACQADGTLAKTDLVFSRGEGPAKYVQDLVREHAAALRDWINQRGASIMVCGGLEMAAGVQAALADILGEEKLDQMTRDGFYRRDIY